MAGQLPLTQWYDHLNDPTVAGAIRDRLLHNVHRLVLKSPWWRKEKPTD